MKIIISYNDNGKEEIYNIDELDTIDKTELLEQIALEFHMIESMDIEY